MTRYAAIPTLYKGIQYRSRLEARWAAYFDQRNWTYIYEPLDLKGYSPDFLVQMGKDSVLVEVKPATEFSQLLAPAARIVRTGWRGMWMVVGADPDVTVYGTGGQFQGRRYLRTEDQEAWALACNTTQWLPSTPRKLCEKCGGVDHLLHHVVCKQKPPVT